MANSQVAEKNKLNEQTEKNIQTELLIHIRHKTQKRKNTHRERERKRKHIVKTYMYLCVLCSVCVGEIK